MPTRNSATRRSLESNRQERQVAFSSARSMFEAQRESQREVREHGDEEYGPMVYKSSMYVEEDNEVSASEAKSINDLIKNFEALSNTSLRDRGRSFSQARVTRSASPVKWKRKANNYEDEQQYHQTVIPAEPPRSTNSRTGTATTTPSSSSNRGRPSVEYSEQSYHDCDATLNQSDVFTDPVSSLTIGEETTLMETTKTLDKVKRTDMNRLANPELPHRFTNSLPIETEFPDKPRTLTWSQNPIMVGEAHHPEDYERGNPDLDPVAESAVYELEKRLDKMEKFELTLHKDKDGYGLSIIGMGIGADSGVEKLGIYVKKVFPGQAAEKVGIQMADQIVEVDGISLVGVSHSFAADTLRSTSTQVRFRMARDIDPESSEVRSLIVNTLQAEERAAMESDQESTDMSHSSSHMEGEYDPNATYDVDRNSNTSYSEKQQDEQLRIMEEAQARILHQLSISQKENSRLQNEIEHLTQEVQRLTRRNHDLEGKNRHLEELMSQNMNSLPRSYDSAHTSNIDDLDDLEESRVDDNVLQNVLSVWSVDEVLEWLGENNLGTLVPVFRLHKIDGRELDRIREKNDSKMLKSLGVQKEQRAQLRTALRALGSTC